MTNNELISAPNAGKRCSLKVIAHPRSSWPRPVKCDLLSASLAYLASERRRFLDLEPWFVCLVVSATLTTEMIRITAAQPGHIAGCRAWQLPPEPVSNHLSRERRAHKCTRDGLPSRPTQRIYSTGPAQQILPRKQGEAAEGCVHPRCARLRCK